MQEPARPLDLTVCHGTFDAGPLLLRENEKTPPLASLQRQPSAGVRSRELRPSKKARLPRKPRDLRAAYNDSRDDDGHMSRAGSPLDQSQRPGSLPIRSRNPPGPSEIIIKDQWLNQAQPMNIERRGEVLEFAPGYLRPAAQDTCDEPLLA
jgi:hypothetical protein